MSARTVPLMEKGKWWILLILILSLYTIHSPAFGQFKPASSPETLAELKGIYLMVNWRADLERKQKGTSPGRIGRDFARQFQRAGIQVFSDKEYERLARTQNYPLARLELHVVPLDIAGARVKIYEITLKAQQLVRLLRKPVIRIWATTWEKRHIASGSGPESVQKNASELIDLFIKTYLSVN